MSKDAKMSEPILKLSEQVESQELWTGHHPPRPSGDYKITPDQLEELKEMERERETWLPAVRESTKQRNSALDESQRIGESLNEELAKNVPPGRFKRKGDLVTVPKEVELHFITGVRCLANLYDWVLYKAGRLSEEFYWPYQNCTDEYMFEKYGDEWASTIELRRMSLNHANERLHEYTHAVYLAKKEKNEETTR